MRFLRTAASAVLFAFVLAVLPACDKPSPKPTPAEMTPIKPGPDEVAGSSLSQDASEVRVKFRRNKDNTCSWELTGDDTDAVLDADRKLRKGVAGTVPQKTE